MLLIQVLGVGCAKCDLLAARAEEAAQKTGDEFSLEKVSDIARIMSFHVMMTPALVVNGNVKCSGTVPSVEQLIQILNESKSF